MLKIKIAGIPIGINNRYRHVEQLCRDYLTDEDVLFTVSATDEQIAKENDISDGAYSPGYLESVVLFRNIAEQIPHYDAVVLHGAVLNKDGKAYAFTAKSGVGKTTHTRLWLDEFGESVHYLNGDKPIIRIIDGTPYAFGTPWCGKEGYGTNESAPLVAIALLERNEQNSAEVIDPEEGTVRLIKQIYIPKDSVSAALAMRIADSIIRSARLVELKCNKEREAALVAYRAMLVE